MMNATIRAKRVANLHPSHQAVNAALTSSGQSLAAIASACGITQDDAEKKLAVLVDEGLASRSKGSRATALYASV